MNKANKVSARKLRFNRAAVLASMALAAMTIGSSHAYATVICSGAVIGIPADINGIYVNFLTQSASSSALPGWDFNAYATSGALNFYSSNSAGNTTRYVGTGTTVDMLVAGTMINSGSSLSNAGVAPGGAFRAGVTNAYMGVVFTNESTATTNYGWASLTTTGPTGFPAMINQYCYENNGGGIMAGGEMIFKNGFDG